MSQPKEHAQHVARIEQQLQTTAKKVWKKPEFPAAHRPNIDRLRSHIRIGTNFSPLPLHPAMKPEHLARAREQRMHHFAEDSLVKVTYYDFTTRDISFGADVVGLPDLQLRRLVYHQAGSNMLNRESAITPDEYTATQRERINIVLNAAFDPTNNITLEQTQIIKPGFRELLLADGYYIAEVGDREATMFDQIYPTAFEIITDQIMRRGGNIASFDAAASNGQLKLVREDTHPRFAQMLFEVLKFVDWRHLLDALKKDSVEQAYTYLDQHLNEEVVAYYEGQGLEANLGAGMIIELFYKMRDDEQAIATVAGAIRRSTSRNN